MEINRTYMTLKEFVAKYVQEASRIASLEIGEPLKIGQDTIFKTILTQVYSGTFIGTPLSTDEVNILFCTYIYPKYKDMYICYGDDATELSYNETKFVRHLVNKIRTTYDENKELINYYESIKYHMMDSIKSKTQNKFNDTPQSLVSEGEVSYNDNYNSTVTTTYGESDGNTKIARFNEVSQLIYDVYDRWMNMVVNNLFMYN